ncbi:MAG: transcriptional regulator, partial [Desulfobacteraceae bacterium]
MANMAESGVLELLQRVAKGIVAVVGPHCEAVIHDLADPEHSVVWIEGRLTGRSVGAPIPDLSFVPDKLNRDTPDQFNYRTRIGTRSLQSSTVWVRDEAG